MKFTHLLDLRFWRNTALIRNDVVEKTIALTLTLSPGAPGERELFYSALDLQLDGERDPAGGNASLAPCAPWERVGVRGLKGLKAPTAWTRFILFALALCLPPKLPAQTPGLSIEPTGQEVRVFWPTNSTGFRLQSIKTFDPSNLWQNVTEPIASNGNTISYVLPATNKSLFFRLFRANSGPTELSSLTLSTNRVDFDNDVSLSFQFANPGDVFTYLTVTRSNWSGVVTERLSAESIGLRPDLSSWSKSIPGRSLSLGTNHFRLVLSGVNGSNSAPLDFQIVLAPSSSGGGSPILSSFNPASLNVRLPSSQRDRVTSRVTLVWSDPDADVERVRIRILRPDGKEARVEADARGSGFIGTAGRTELNLIRMTRNDPAGVYEYRCELVDRAGNSSGAKPYFVTLGINGSTSGPSIHSAFVNPEASTNSLVLDIYGNGFDPMATNNHVSINGESLSVIAAFGSVMTVSGPLNLRAGSLRVKNDRGVAYSTVEFSPPAYLSLFPSNAVLSPGQTQNFEVEHNAPTGAPLVWSINGTLSGNGSSGQFLNGSYRAPESISSNQVVYLTATVSTNTNWTATATIQLVPRSLTRGGDRVDAISGGTVVTRDGRAQIEIPPGALSSNTLVTLRVLDGSERPAADPGKRILSAVEFGPDGISFAAPARVTFPLLIAQSPGATLPVKLFIPSSGVLASEGIMATVSSNGASATAEISHFSAYVIEGTTAGTNGGPVPQISSFTTATPLEEGRSVPVRLNGINLNSDLEPEILAFDGSPTSEVTPGTLFVGGTEAGLVLHINVLRDLSTGLHRQFRLRLKRSDGVTVETNFSVAGLDEFFLRNGQTVELSEPPPRTWSEIVMEPGSTLRLRRGTLSWHCTGPVRLDGFIDAGGRDGGPGIARNGGARGLSGGAGGLGRIDNGCWCFIVCVNEEADCAETENFGSAGDRVSLFGYPGTFPPFAGFGGGPGHNRNIVEDFFDIITSIVSLIADGIACVGSAGTACIVLVADVVSTVSNIAEVFDEESTIGKTGLRGVPSLHESGNRSGHGGGGGGGGGRYSYIFTYEAGGGAGAGGDGGSGLEIVGLNEVTAGGAISTRGGNGGAGSLDGERVVAREGGSDQAGFSGGAGGGGSAGDLRILAGQSLVTRAGFQTDFRGGISGVSGLVVRDPARGVDSLIVTASQRAADGLQETRAANAGLSALDDRVVAGSIFVVEPDSNILRGTAIRVRGEQAGQNNLFYLRANVPKPIQLFPGFNKVTVERPDTTGDTFLVHHVLALLGGDADGDTLYAVDEALLGTDPNNPDTDGDTLNDGDEVRRGTNPRLADSDRDGLNDNDEITRNLDPLERDTNNNGVWDSGEVFLAEHPFGTGTLIAQIGLGGAGGVLGFLDVTSGSVGVWGTLPGNFAHGLTTDGSANLYYTQFGRLYRMNLSEAWDKGTVTAVGKSLTNVTLVGNLGNNRRALALASDPVSKNLFAVEATSGFVPEPTGQLLSINPLTGASTRLSGTNSLPVRVLAFSPMGELFGLVSGTGNDDLVRIDPATGLITGAVGGLGQSNSFGLAFGIDGQLKASATPAEGTGIISQMPTNGVAGSVQRTFPVNLFAISYLRCPGPCFGDPVFSSGVVGAGAVLVVNYNNDGIPDLLVGGKLDGQEPAAAWVLQGKTNGTFDVVATVTLRGWAQGVAVPVAHTDLNGDGRRDLILINPTRDPTVFRSTPPELVFAFGLAGGGFGAPIYSEAVVNVQAAAAIDANNDGFMDVVTSSGGFTKTLNLLINMGNGTFSAAQEIFPGTILSGISRLAVGDVNNDNRPDLVAKNDQGLVVIPGSATGFGNPQVTQSFELDTGALRLADLNGDGFMDATVGRYGGGSHNLAGVGNGSFQQPSSFNLPIFASGVFGDPGIGDLNGDLRDDLAQAAEGENVEVFLGQPTLNPLLLPAVLHTVRTGVRANVVAIADMNGDGLPDIISIGGRISVVLQEPEQ